jgi:hypothetical protein
MSTLRGDLSKGRWEAIHMSTIRDQRLSLDALGALVRFQAKPEGWQVRMAAAQRELGVGRNVMRRILREWTGAGYLERVRSRSPSGQWAWESVLHWVSVRPSPTIGRFSVDGSTVDGSTGGRVAVGGQPVDVVQTQKQDRVDLHQTTTTTEPIVVVGLEEPPLLKFRESIRSSLLSCPSELRQAVIDEATGVWAEGKVRSNLGGLVRTLCVAAAEGSFRFHKGVAVAQARDSAARDSARKVADEEERRRRSSPDAVAASNRARDELLARHGRPRSSSSVVANATEHTVRGVDQ